MDTNKIIQDIENATLCSFDTETRDLEHQELVAFSFCLDGKSYFMPVHMTYIDNITEDCYKRVIKALLRKPGVIYHNHAFDALVTYKAGFKQLPVKAHDTLLISHLINENESHKLKDLVKKYLGFQMLKFTDVCGTGKKQISFADIKDEALAKEYSEADALYTYKLFKLFYPKLNEYTKSCYEEIERPLLNVVHRMHIRGVPINFDKIKGIEKVCTDKVTDYKQQLSYYMKGVNLNSPKQLQEYFLKKKHMPIVKLTKTKAPAMDSEVMEAYAKKGCIEAGLINNYKKYSTLLKTFVPAFIPDLEGNAHPKFNQCGTISGRFSSSNPNYQNIPKSKDADINFRDAVEAPLGYKLVGFDYSGIEMRLVSEFADEKKLLKVFAADEDIHQNVADDVGCERDQAKTLSYALLYGAGVRVVAKNMKTNEREARMYMNKFQKEYREIGSFIQFIKKEVVKNGFINTGYGRQRHLSEDFAYKLQWQQGAELRSIVNSSVQSPAAGMLKCAMINIDKEIVEYDAWLILTIHDELIYMVKEEEAEEVAEIVKKCMMAERREMGVKIEVEGKIDTTWFGVH